MSEAVRYAVNFLRAAATSLEVKGVSDETFEQAAALREPMACGHPKACWVKERHECDQDGNVCRPKCRSAHCLTCKQLVARDAEIVKLREVLVWLLDTGRPLAYCDQTYRNKIEEIRALLESKTK